MSWADDVTALVEKLRPHVQNVSSVTALPQELEAVGWEMTQMGVRVRAEASRRAGSVPVGRAEAGADRLSTDGVRNPDLTYGDPQ